MNSKKIKLKLLNFLNEMFNFLVLQIFEFVLSYTFVFISSNNIVLNTISSTERLKLLVVAFELDSVVEIYKVRFATIFYQSCIIDPFADLDTNCRWFSHSLKQPNIKIKPKKSFRQESREFRCNCVCVCMWVFCRIRSEGKSRGLEQAVFGILYKYSN